MQTEPNIADWITAVSASGAFIAAAVAAGIAWRVHRRDRLDRRASQARLIAAWVAFRNDVLCLITKNNSQLPVYWGSLQVEMVAPPESAGGPPDQVLETHAIPVWEPGEQVQGVIADKTIKTYQSLSNEGYDCRVSIQFVDAANQAWLRDKKGRLIPAKDVPR